jgi:hypothetical protein
MDSDDDFEVATVLVVVAVGAADGKGSLSIAAGSEMEKD